MRQRPDYGDATPEDLARALLRSTKRKPQEPVADGPESWTLSVSRIFDDAGLRLDAGYHNPNAVSETIRRMKESNLKLKRLGDLAEVRLPTQFARVWASDEEHGSPYLNATDLLNLFVRGVPTGDMRYLSRSSRVDFDALVLRKNTLLVTCSGTIGRVYHVPQRLDGWAATHDLIRVTPDDDLAGYLYAWCLSPAAQVQITNPTHGAQIDHITDDQLREILVPVLPAGKMRAINAEVLGALEVREAALATIIHATKHIV